MAIMLVLCLFGITLTSCTDSAKSTGELSSGEDITGNYDNYDDSGSGMSDGISSYDFFLRNEEGNYIYGEIILPEYAGSGTVSGESSKAGAIPLVFMAHGFRGTLNSGGGRELAERLAKAGIAAVRIDFNPYIITEKEASRISGLISSSEHAANVLYDTENRPEYERTDIYTLKDMCDYSCLAIDYALQNYNIDRERVGIYGRSMGGRLAMIMANENTGDYDFKAMTLIAPAGDAGAMVYYMGGSKRWNEMKKEAAENGYVEKQTLLLEPEWFEQFEAYDPSETGSKFGDKPVLLYYNTKDNVVRPKTSLKCAKGYSNAEIHKVTTDDGHGYEMSYEKSDLKEKIMTRTVEFFKDTL
ncbi:MAG: prolyl oligopeptidase family serine peptidase [Clostridia bacterium]|nr:prolyl oligopeptidase family serine peptidase [Clostridia bacterium]